MGRAVDNPKACRHVTGISRKYCWFYPYLLDREAVFAAAKLPLRLVRHCQALAGGSRLDRMCVPCLVT